VKLARISYALSYFRHTIIRRINKQGSHSDSTTIASCWHATPPTYCTIVFDDLALDAQKSRWAATFCVPFRVLPILSSVLLCVFAVYPVFRVAKYYTLVPVYVLSRRVRPSTIFGCCFSAFGYIGGKSNKRQVCRFGRHLVLSHNSLCIATNLSVASTVM
jgi:hypothetical protein